MRPDKSTLGNIWDISPSKMAKLFSSLAPGMDKQYSLQSSTLLKVFSNSTVLDDFTKMGLAYRLLARHGWFVSFLTSTITTCEAAICFIPKKQDTNKGNQIMVEHYRKITNSIEKRSEREFPARRLVLEKAFDAHRRGNYELSIPVMLAQADGIGKEIFGFSPYEKGKKIFKNHIECEIDPDSLKLFRDYFFCVSDDLSIKKSSNATKPPFPFTRHLILHGISTDYATEINAFKSLSWLQYIVSFKTEAKPKPEPSKIDRQRLPARI